MGGTPPDKLSAALLPPDLDELRVRHDREHTGAGSDLLLPVEDLERLSLVLQPPSGGLIDDRPVRIADLIGGIGGAGGSVRLADAERAIRDCLEDDLRHEEESLTESHDSDPTEAMVGLSIRDDPDAKDGRGAGAGSSQRKDQDEDEDEDEGYHKELSYTNLRGKTTLLKPNSRSDVRDSSSSSDDNGPGSVGGSAPNGRLHDLHISDCSDAIIYLLQPFEHATIAGCTGCTIVVGAIAGLLHIVDCERTKITTAARRVLVSNCFDVLHCVFTPSPPLLVGDNRSCQFAPYNTYYDGMREDLLATGLAAALVNPHGSAHGGTDAPQPALQCASNKWKQPVELAKLELPQLPPTSSSGAASAGGGFGGDDKAMKGADDSIQTPILLPPSEFQILFVPVDTDAMRQRRSAEEMKEMERSRTIVASSSQDDADDAESAAGRNKAGGSAPLDSQYCRILSDVLQLSPFRLPSDYERRALVKAERMKKLQVAMQNDLTEEQKLSLEDELNAGFRDWLVTSGNLRQVLDLVHMERKEQEA